MIIKSIQRFATSNVREKIRQQRETRLGKLNMDHILPMKTSQELEKIRNIGIIAHIDAGKTTTTERMLYYAGALPSPGDINEGTTTMDFMKQQRQRGITIRSASITFNWHEHQINLIDTPGHVDFSAEVTRSLKVLDSVITILDGVKGVESQTSKVWKHASKCKIPKLSYINKMDRIGSSISQTVQSMKQKLAVQPLIMQKQIGQANLFKGIIDLVELKEIYFNNTFGQDVQVNIINDKAINFSEILKAREILVGKVADYDDEICQMYLLEQFVTPIQLRNAICRIMHHPEKQHLVCPVFIGTSYRNKGVQCLMDAIVTYLPSPSQRQPINCVLNTQNTRKPLKNEPLTIYIFKMVHDTEMGVLAYARIYSGQLTKNMTLINSCNQNSERISNIYRVRANQYVSIDEASAGDIVALSGLKQSVSGDTLIAKNADIFLLEKLQLPSAIFTLPFELQSNRLKKQFTTAITKAILEDNSLKFKFQEETGQYLISGLGQLHLEILKDKLIDDGIPVKIGKLKTNFKETINTLIQKHFHFKNQIKPTLIEQFEIDIEIEPIHQQNQIQTTNKIVFAFDRIKQFDDYWYQFIKLKEGKGKLKKNEEDQTRQSKNLQKISKKYFRNPTPMEPINNQEEDDQNEQYHVEDDNEDQDDETEVNENNNQYHMQQTQQPLYHISTLPFETLYELMEACRASLLSGRNNYPMIAVQLRIINGVYRKSTFSKTAMKKCATIAIRNVLESNSVLLQPMMDIHLQGQTVMLDLIIKDIIKKRGSIYDQNDYEIYGSIPAAEIKGWIKQIRSTGLDVDIKFKGYEQVNGIDPIKLLQNQPN